MDVTPVGKSTKITLVLEGLIEPLMSDVGLLLKDLADLQQHGLHFQRIRN